MRSWTDENLTNAVLNSLSLTEALTELGIGVSGASFRHIRQHIARLQISTEHFRRKRASPKRSLQEIHNMKRLNSTSEFKRRLIQEGVLEYRCSLCQQPPEWNGKPLVLQLDHIDGNVENNQIYNLRILCPNCHTQTGTYAARNRARPKAVCSDCGVNIQRRSKKCSKCHQKMRRDESTSVKKVCPNGRVRYYRAEPDG